MKFFGLNIKTKEKGYFGVRRCTECNALRDVNLVEIYGTERMFFIPTKKLNVKRFLICTSCGAALEINNDLWNYYKTYNRFDKPTTDKVVQTLKQIDVDLANKNVDLRCEDKTSQTSLNLIFNNLIKKFGNPNNLEELISVYFSRD